MAERRMFAKTIIDSDAFLDMPMSARLLYYDLAMRADDDGFINSPKKIMRFVGASMDDLNILAIRKFIIPFDNGVVVIKHWRIHNYIRKDTYKETTYTYEKSLLEEDRNHAYRLINSDKTELCQPSVNEPSCFAYSSSWLRHTSFALSELSPPSITSSSIPKNLCVLSLSPLKNIGSGL